MNYRLLSKLCGVILLIIGIAMLACVGFAFAETQHGVRAMSLSTLITLGAGGVLVFLGRGSTNEVLRRDAVALVGLGWLLAAAFGAIPFMLAKRALTPAEAFFESMSGFTTTGSTVMTSISAYPHSILLWRSLTQWMGGLGILALFVAVMASLGVSSKSLFRHESSLNLGDSRTSRIRQMATRLWIVYVVITVVCGVGMWIIGQMDDSISVSVFDAVCHALTTPSTGGFSPLDASIGAYDSVVMEVFLCFFMFISSWNLLLWASLFTGNLKHAAGKEEACAFAGVIFLGIALITYSLMSQRGLGFGSALREAFFPVITLASSTGFTTKVDYDLWPVFSQMVLVLIMVIGGCAGSTAGGVKISRVLLTFRFLRQEIIKSFRPNQVFTTKLNGHVVDDNGRVQVLSFMALSGIIILGSMAVLSLIEPKVQDIQSVLGAVLGTLFNMGPGLGSVGPTDNFAGMRSGSLILLSMLMMLGRLEFFAVIALFMPTLWKRY